MDWLKDIQRTYKKFICSLAKYVIMINRTLWHIKLNYGTGGISSEN